MTFKDLGLIDPILKALADQGYEKPSPIQEKAIAPALAGRDVLGCAQTGTGKTCAFATPILQQLYARPVQGKPIRTLILTPTRELALQIQESFQAYGKNLSLRSAVIFGGVGQAPQVDKLRRGIDILVATPGRLMDLQGQGFVDLSRLEIFVLDEADRMLDMGFIHDVRKILKLLPEKKQTLFFSATMPPEITELVNSLLKNPVKVAVDPVSSPVEVIDQSVYLVDKGNKSKLLAKLITDEKAKNALVFTRTKHGANKVAADLAKAGITAAAIHGNKSQTARQQALADFKSGKIRALVATDIAARGLDIEELGHVFNYNLPEVPETYVHRIGRTGRAGREGTAVAFCDFGEQQYLKDIEKLIGKKIPLMENHPWPMEIFEAPKDAKGRPVNADDAEARAAARERKALRNAERRAAQTKKDTAVPAGREKNSPPKGAKAAAPEVDSSRRGRSQEPKPRNFAAPKPAATRPAPTASIPGSNQPKKSKRGYRHQDLQGTMPSAPQQAQSSFHRPGALDGDKIMDATARLLAPRPKPAAPAPTSAPAGQGSSARRSSPSSKNGGKPNTGRTQTPTAPIQQQSRPAQKPTPQPQKQEGKPHNDRNRGRGRRGGPPEVTLRPGSQKDSTEQPTLVKPYYISYDD